MFGNILNEIDYFSDYLRANAALRRHRHRRLEPLHHHRLRRIPFRPRRTGRRTISGATQSQTYRAVEPTPATQMPPVGATNPSLRPGNRPPRPIRGIIHAHRRSARPPGQEPPTRRGRRCPANSDHPADIYPTINRSARRCQRSHAAALRLAAETGRRPGELVSLKYDCFDTESDGGPFLIYTETKVTAGQERRLPVLDVVVETVRKHQVCTRQRYPDTPIADLRLFPRASMNPHGYHAMASSLFGETLRKWIDALPRLDSTEFDATDNRCRSIDLRSRVTPTGTLSPLSSRVAISSKRAGDTRVWLLHDGVWRFYCGRL